jgi:hypothetical protein
MLEIRKQAQFFTSTYYMRLLYFHSNECTSMQCIFSRSSPKRSAIQNNIESVLFLCLSLFIFGSYDEAREDARSLKGQKQFKKVMKGIY